MRKTFITSFITFFLLTAHGMAKDSLCRVLLIGDSLSSGYGLLESKSWTALLRDKLSEDFSNVQLINKSVSGYTSANALALLKNQLPLSSANIVIIEIGGNDGLRGLPPTIFRKNMYAMRDEALANGAKLVILGVRLPRNLPEKYRQEHHKVYTDLLEEHYGTAFFLERVAEQNLFQNDQIHPLESAQSILLENSYPSILQALSDEPTCDRVYSPSKPDDAQ